MGSFSPIFHFQYKDLVMLESELEIEVNDEGETETNLEYLTIDWFLNDYAALVGGKFLSPVGQFRQNLHPSWINKLPSAPPGFGHDGAAPTSELGVQLRGGLPLGKLRSNYAYYVGNGPELIAEFEDGEFELDGIDAEAKGTVTSIEGGGGHDEEEEGGEEEGLPDLHGEEARDYNVLGFDAVYQYKTLPLRGEYMKSEVGSATTGATASEGGEWESWYTQAS